MKRRADLLFRTENLGLSIQVDKLRRCSMDEAIKAQEKGENFCITGSIVELFPNIVVSSSAWNWKDSPLSYRQGLLLKDISGSHSHFLVWLFGHYAHDFELLNAKKGEYLTITNPFIEDSYSFTTNDESNDVPLHRHQLRVGYERDGLQHKKVCIHSKLPEENSRRVSNNMMVQQLELTINPQNTRQYTFLKDCLPTPPSKRYNAWGIVTKITRFPTPSKRGNKISAQVYIEDQHSPGSWGFTNYQFSILGDSVADFPPILLHSVLRIHHLSASFYQQELTFRVFDPRAVTVFAGKEGDPVQPLSTKPESELEFSQEDDAKVKEIRSWWSLAGRKRSAIDSNGMSQEMTQKLSDIKPGQFNLICKVLKVLPGDKGIVVTDGTAVSDTFLSWDEGNAVLHKDSEDDRKSLTIFNKVPNQSIKLEEGVFVHLFDVESVQVDEFFGEMKLVFSFEDNKVIELTKEYSSVKEIMRRLENKPVQRKENEVSDDTLNALLAPMESQTQTQSEPFVRVYPSNLEVIELESEEGTGQDADPGKSNHEENVVDADSENEALSQEFYTCPDNHDEIRMSPSPEREVNYVVSTNTDFPWITIQELEKDATDPAITSFRLRGYVSDVAKTKTLKSTLALVCAFCCKVASYDGRNLKCPDCQKERAIIFHLSLVIEEYLPQLMVRSGSPNLKLFLAGKHAENLLGVTAQEYASTPSVRKIVSTKLQGLLDKAVTLSVCRSADEGKHYGYQIVYSYFIADQ